MALPLARSTRTRNDPMNPRSSKTLLIVMVVYALYTLVPLVWLLFSSTKTQSGLFSSFGLWFADDFAFIDNLVATFSFRDGIFLRWLGNTLLYVVVGAGGATLLATSLAIAAFGFAIAPLFGSGHVAGVLLFFVAGFTLMGFTYGPLGTALAELFPTAVRYTGASLTFNLGGIVGASVAPYIATWLATHFGLGHVGYYLAARA